MIEPNDSLLRAVRRLHSETPDPGREQRVRLRCHQELHRQAARQERAKRRALWRSRLVQAAAAVGLMLYLAAVVGDTLRLAG